MNKVLIVILAETRAHELTFDLFEQNFQKVLNSDIALCVGNNKNTVKNNNKFYENAKFIWEIEEPKIAENLYDEIAKKNNYGEEWKEILKNVKGLTFSKLFKQEARRGAVSFLYYFRWLLLQKIKENNLSETYQWFIITRSDFMWKTPHPKCEYLDQDYIYSPDGEYGGGITDRHMIIPSKYIEKALGILDYILKNSKDIFISEQNLDKILSIEQMLEFYFKKVQLYDKIIRYPYNIYTVRTKNGPTSWSTGKYYEDLGYCIKYIREYNLYLANSKYIKSQEDWKKYFDTIKLRNNTLQIILKKIFL